MSELSNKYQNIIKELEENVKDEKELLFVKEKFSELSLMFLNVIDRLTYATDMKIKNIEETQRELETRVNGVQTVINNIESDIYEEDEGYEFEIICPYCNYQFIANIESEINEEIECPECHNMIELDWNYGEEECTHCSHNCGEYNEQEESCKMEKEEKAHKPERISKNSKENEIRNKKNNKTKSKDKMEKRTNTEKNEDDEDM